MRYQDMSKEQQDGRQKIWVSVLDRYCPSIVDIDEDGNEYNVGRPCDLGAMCDKCHYDYELNLFFVREVLRVGLPISDNEIEKYKEELEG